MTNESRNLYHPELTVAQKLDIVRSHRVEYSTKNLVSVLVDILVQGKKNEREVRNRPNWKKELSKQVGQAVHKYPIEIVINAFEAWNYVPDKLFAAMTNALKRHAASELEKHSASLKKPSLDKGLLQVVLGYMEGSVHENFGKGSASPSG